MAESKKRIGKETASVGLRLPQFVGYSDYFYETPLYVQIKNLSGESAPFSVSVTGGELLVPFEEEAEVPFESAVELTAEGVFSPSSSRSGKNCGRRKSSPSSVITKKSSSARA